VDVTISASLKAIASTNARLKASRGVGKSLI
jgi:hypothetical protein